LIGERGAVAAQERQSLHQLLGDGEVEAGSRRRILVFGAGLLCPLLFVTGVIRWLQKRRAKRMRPERRAARQIEA
jgi:uncharacterized iron-regulated membrane protein